MGLLTLEVNPPLAGLPGESGKSGSRANIRSSTDSPFAVACRMLITKLTNHFDY